MVITNRFTTTIVQFTYKCNGIQWSSSGTKHAVVGLNLHKRRVTLPASTYPSVADTTSSCSDHQLNKRDNGKTPQRSVCTTRPCCVTCPKFCNDDGTNTTKLDEKERKYCECLGYIRLYSNFFGAGRIVFEINEKIPPCPNSRDRAEEDKRFIHLNSSTNNCYVWAFYESCDHELCKGKSFTKQCCYNDSNSM